MKSMKKRVMAAVLTAVMVIATFANVVPVGAASLTADQYLNKMTKAANKAASYEVKTNVVQNATTDGQKLNTKAVSKQIVFVDPMKSKLVTTTTIKGAGLDSKTKTITYVKQNAKGKIYEYISTDGSKYEKMNMTGMVDDLNGMEIENYSNAKIVKKNVKVNKISTVQISAEVSGADLGEVLAAAGLGSTADDTEIDYSALKPVKATLWIDRKTYLPVKVSTDMTDFLNSYLPILYQSLGLGTEDVSVEYSKAISTATYSNFNHATNFTIPKACK